MKIHTQELPSKATNKTQDMTTGSDDSTNLTWEKFEELAKVAFVADPHADTRFFLKTRVTPAAKAATGQKKPSKSVVKIVARVSTRPRKPTGNTDKCGDQKVTAQSIAYQTSLVSHLSRLTRLLRFVMQEVLGPMKPAFLPAGSGTVSAGQAPQPPQLSAAPSDKNKSKKKKKGGKK